MNGALEFDLKVKGIGFHINPPDIDHLAKGTNNWRGGTTWVGEKGPELLDLPRGSKVLSNSKSNDLTTQVHMMNQLIAKLLDSMQGFFVQNDLMATVNLSTSGGPS